MLFWLVDPLDGTKEFISRNGEFTVNIGLVDDRQPVLGVVLAPARGLVWWGSLGQGACRREGGSVTQIQRPPTARGGGVAVASRSHRDAETDAWLQGAGHRRDGLGGQLAQVLPRRRGPGRRLPALRADHGMGHRSRPCRAARSRRAGDDGRRRTVPLRQARLPQSRVHRLRRLSGACSRRGSSTCCRPRRRIGRRSGCCPGCRHAAAERPRLRVRLAGLDLPHPIGLAAGFDKDGEVFAAVLRQGFAWVEVGTVTPRPQPGNPRPRLFRLAVDGAVINRMGFNNQGVAALAATPRPARSGGGRRRGEYRHQQGRERARRRLSGRSALACTRWPTTSPSTSPRPTRRGCARCKSAAALDRLLTELGAERARLAAAEGCRRPLFLKIAPDLAPAAEADIADLAHCAWCRRRDRRQHDACPAGLAAFARRRRARRPQRPAAAWRPPPASSAGCFMLLRGRVPLIGVGGIASGGDVYAQDPGRGQRQCSSTLPWSIEALAWSGPCCASSRPASIATATRPSVEAVGMDAPMLACD